MNNPLPSEDELREVLRDVIDPEVGVNIVDLGLVYGIDVSPEAIHIAATMTTPACPMGSYITDAIRDTVRAHAPQIPDVQVHLVWEPPWEPQMMSDTAKRYLGWSDE